MTDERSRSDGTQPGAGERLRPRQNDEEGNADNVGGDGHPGAGGSSGMPPQEEDDRRAGGTSCVDMRDIKPLGAPSGASPDARPTGDDGGRKRETDRVDR